MGEYTEATHVLVYKYWSNKSKWDTLVESHARQGIWFVSSSWAKGSLGAKRRLPELQHCIPNGEVAVRSTPVKVQRIPVVDLSKGIAGAPPKPTTAGSKGDYEFSVERLDEMIQAQYDAASGEERERPQMARRLNARVSCQAALSPGRVVRLVADTLQHPAYSVGKWQALFREWKTRIGRFRFLPPLEKEKEKEAFQALEETPLRVQAEHGRSEGSTSAARPTSPPNTKVYGPSARMTVEALATTIQAIHRERLYGQEMSQSEMAKALFSRVRLMIVTLLGVFAWRWLIQLLAFRI